MRQLGELLQGFEYECIQGTIEREVGRVVYDSRKVEQNCLFICIVGENFDGHIIKSKVSTDCFFNHLVGVERFFKSLISCRSILILNWSSENRFSKR